MKKINFTKTIACITATITTAVSVLGINANAYWTTQSFANYNATAYNSTSFDSVYAYTDSSLANINRWVYIANINYNANQMSSPYYKISKNGKVTVNYLGSGFTISKTSHNIQDWPTYSILMNA